MPYPQAEHAQCNDCGKMIRGPHEGKYYTERRDPTGALEPIYAADREGAYYVEEAHARGLQHNVSGSMCPECYQKKLDTYRAQRDQAKAQETTRAEALRQTRHREHERREAKERRQRQEAQEDTASPVERARKRYANRGKESARKVEGM